LGRRARLRAAGAARESSPASRRRLAGRPIAVAAPAVPAGAVDEEEEGTMTGRDARLLKVSSFSRPNARRSAAQPARNHGVRTSTVPQTPHTPHTPFVSQDTRTHTEGQGTRLLLSISRSVSPFMHVFRVHAVAASGLCLCLYHPLCACVRACVRACAYGEPRRGCRHPRPPRRPSCAHGTTRAARASRHRLQPKASPTPSPHAAVAHAPPAYAHGTQARPRSANDNKSMLAWMHMKAQGDVANPHDGRLHTRTARVKERERPTLTHTHAHTRTHTNKHTLTHPDTHTDIHAIHTMRTHTFSLSLALYVAGETACLLDRAAKKRSAAAATSSGLCLCHCCKTSRAINRCGSATAKATPIKVVDGDTSDTSCSTPSAISQLPMPPYASIHK
jgi:hypothetical protein